MDGLLSDVYKMRRIIFVIVVLLLSTVSMAQKIEVTENGLNVFSIGDNVNQVKLDIKSANGRIKRQELIAPFTDRFNYYFIASDSMFMEQAGLISEVFIGTDTTGKICGIFMVLKDASENILPVLTKALGDPRLKSETAIGDQSLWSKVYWPKNDIDFFLKKGSGYYEIKMTRRGIQGPTPAIGMVDL